MQEFSRQFDYKIWELRLKMSINGNGNGSWYTGMEANKNEKPRTSRPNSAADYLKMFARALEQFV